MIRITGFLLLIAVSALAFAEQKTVTMSDFQRTFVKTVQAYSSQYKAAPNELKKSAIARKRSEALAAINGDYRNINGWFGTIEKLGTNGDGDAYLTIHLIVDRIMVGTWSTSLSDLGSNTLIKNGSSLYNDLSEMEVGNVVRFSGAIGKVKNVTESGKMTEPDFLFWFTSVEKVGDSAAQ